jgi:Zn-dependent protease
VTNLLGIALAAVAAILAITLHEAAHGYAALALGDDTARQAGRLSLNPLRHIDRVGTILLPGLLLLSQLALTGRVFFMFGWAKPVPVAAWKFGNPRRGMALVAIAGPAMNFFLAWLAAVFLPSAVPTSLPSSLTQDFLVTFIVFNLVLGLFNLLPIPPLDGGRIAVGILPLQIARSWARLERAGILLVILLIFLLPRIFPGFDQALEETIDWVFSLVLRLAGHHIGGGNVHI